MEPRFPRPAPAAFRFASNCRCPDGVRSLSRERTAAVPKLIHRNAGSAVAGNCTQGCHPAVVRRHRPVNEQAGREELMSAAEQAFLLTGELFVLSFVAILAFWFADKLRRNFTGKP
jgi:hypothetical protein